MQEDRVFIHNLKTNNKLPLIERVMGVEDPKRLEYLAGVARARGFEKYIADFVRSKDLDKFIGALVECSMWEAEFEPSRVYHNYLRFPKEIAPRMLLDVDWESHVKPWITQVCHEKVFPEVKEHLELTDRQWKQFFEGRAIDEQLLRGIEMEGGVPWWLRQILFNATVIMEFNAHLPEFWEDMYRIDNEFDGDMELREIMVRRYLHGY